MKISVFRENSTLIVRPKCGVEGLDAFEFRKVHEGAMQPVDRALIPNSNELSHISRAGLHVVTIIVERFEAAGNTFELCSLSDLVNKVIAASGFNRSATVPGLRAEAREAVMS